MTDLAAARPDGRDVLDVAGYLARLGITDPGPPSPDALRALHAAHAERVPYETIAIQLGEGTTVDPYDAAERIVRHRRGGYCFHLNGAFATLLTALGYRVQWHRGGVQGRGDPAPIDGERSPNHLVLTVHGLPAPHCPDGVWLADVGLGDALHEPVPLRRGEVAQGPFTYALEPSAVVTGGWRFRHDPGCSFAGLDFTLRAAGPTDFAVPHAYLSTSPESPFVRKAFAQRRDRAGADVLVGCVLTRLDGRGRTERELTAARDWYAALADLFGLTLDEVSVSRRRALWERVRAAHEGYQAAGARDTGSARRQGDKGSVRERTARPDRTAAADG